MKQKSFFFLTGCLLSLSLLTGCGQTEEIPEEIEPEYVFDTTGETSELGVDLTQRNALSQLENNSFYVVHNKVAYPLYYEEYSSNSEDILEADDSINTDRKLFYYSDTEHNIPTLYKGDYLMYYSTDTLLDTIMWERFYDEDYSVGLYNLQKMTADRYKINLDDDDDYPILKNSSLYTEVEQITSTELLVDKIATVPITSEFIKDGIIKGLTPNTDYDIELYTGSQFLHYTTSADYHIFSSYEAFLSIEYDTLQDYVYKIKIPDYFVNGYYTVNNFGMFRYVKNEQYYNSDTNFNEPLLYLSEEQIEKQEAKRVYSHIDELNSFISQVPDTLGYVDPLAEDEIEENQEIVGYSEDGTPIIEFKKSVTKEFTLWIPENVVGLITIESSKNEKTGEITLITDTNTKTAHYDPINQSYILDVNGKGEIATLQISGFYNSYDIKLTNIEEYHEQDKIVEEVIEEEPEENTSFLQKITGLFHKE